MRSSLSFAKTCVVDEVVGRPNRVASTGRSNGMVNDATATSVRNIARTAVAPFRSAVALPGGRHREIRRVVRVELGQPGHVAARAVGERRGGDELDFLARLEHLATAGEMSSLLIRRVGLVRAREARP